MARTFRYSSQDLVAYIPGDWITITVEHNRFRLPIGVYRRQVIHAIHKVNHWLLRLAPTTKSGLVISFRIYPEHPGYGFINADAFPCAFTLEQNLETRLRRSLVAKGVKFEECNECGELEYGQRHKCKAND